MLFVEAISKLEAAGKRFWAIEVMKNKLRLILEGPKKVAQNEEYRKDFLATNDWEKMFHDLKENYDSLVIDINAKEGIIQSLKEQNARFKEENAMFNSLGHKCESLEKKLLAGDQMVFMSNGGFGASRQKLTMALQNRRAP